jgi:hypothetical protein
MLMYVIADDEAPAIESTIRDIARELDQVVRVERAGKCVYFDEAAYDMLAGLDPMSGVHIDRAETGGRLIVEDPTWVADFEIGIENRISD